jgi:ferredoxin
MKRKRSIIEIDEALCNGCGQCISACAEGALKLVDGKARLIGDIYCDGLGACIGDCPQGALKIIERPADDFDESMVNQTHAPASPRGETLPCGCPSSAMMSLNTINTASDALSHHNPSELIHWPVKLQLLGPQAPFLKGADLILLADCAAVACPNLHREILKDKAVAIGCPKLDDLEAHIIRLSAIIKGSHPRSLTVVHMEVPCCSAFMHAAQEAIRHAGIDIPLKRTVIGRTGTILRQD